ncbi:MAG: hypothetical protein MZV63_36920 [Marinilabiliales bacterium]|nr:hypothetical protein [Marinilabiliales bacterium]
MTDKKSFAANFVIFEKESNRIEAARLVEPSGKMKCDCKSSIPSHGLKHEADRTYDLPYTYLPHPEVQ